MATTPEVGMGATVNHWSDRTACTIVEVSGNLKRITLRADKTTRTDNNGMSEMQTYSYAPNPEGGLYYATLRKDGRYRLTGSKESVTIGVRNQYYDFSF